MRPLLRSLVLLALAGCGSAFADESADIAHLQTRWAEVNYGLPQAQREKAFIKRLIAAGKTKAEIKDALVAEYGDAVLALPQGSGFSLSAYLVPIVAFALERREKWSLLWLLIPQRIGYRQVMYYVVLKAITQALRGPRVGWGKLQRTGRVQAAS